MNLRILFNLAMASCALLTLSPDVRADEPLGSPASQPADAATTHWYGWQTLLSDGASAATIGTSLALSGTSADGTTRDAWIAPFFVGVGGYAIGAPIVHLAHGEPWRAAGSLALRTALPTMGIFLGSALAGSCTDTGYGCFMHGAAEGAAGAAIAMVGASILDASLLAYEPVTAREAKPSPSLALAPQIDPTRGVYGVSLVGRGF